MPSRRLVVALCVLVALAALPFALQPVASWPEAATVRAAAASFDGGLDAEAWRVIACVAGRLLLAGAALAGAAALALPDRLVHGHPALPAMLLLAGIAVPVALLALWVGWQG